MKKTIHFLLIFIFCTGFLHAEEEGIQGIRLTPGMEYKKIGGINLTVPEGATVYQDGPNVIMEELEEYVGRRFKEVEGRLEKIERSQEELKKELEQLHEAQKRRF